MMAGLHNESVKLGLKPAEPVVEILAKRPPNQNQHNGFAYTYESSWIAKAVVPAITGSSGIRSFYICDLGAVRAWPLGRLRRKFASLFVARR
jgi:hypothetical protein